MERALPGPAGQEGSARQPLLKDTGSGKAPALKALKIPIVWGGWDSTRSAWVTQHPNDCNSHRVVGPQGASVGLRLAGPQKLMGQVKGKERWGSL